MINTEIEKEMRTWQGLWLGITLLLNCTSMQIHVDKSKQEICPIHSYCTFHFNQKTAERDWERLGGSGRKGCERTQGFDPMLCKRREEKSLKKRRREMKAGKEGGGSWIGGRGDPK